MKTLETKKVERTDLLERLIEYSSQLVYFCQKLSKENSGFILAKQLLRCGTAIGANVHEAQGGQSKADFVSKISIAYKEALETLYWFRVLGKSGLISPEEFDKWLDETTQLSKILSSILLTSKIGPRQHLVAD